MLWRCWPANIAATGRNWRRTPDRLADEILELLGDHRLAEVYGDVVRLLPAAWRYGVAVEADEGEGTGVEQASLL